MNAFLSFNELQDYLSNYFKFSYSIVIDKFSGNGGLSAGKTIPNGINLNMEGE